MKDINEVLCELDNGRDIENFLSVLKQLNSNSFEKALSHERVYRHIFLCYPRTIVFDFFKNNVDIFLKDEKFIKNFVDCNSIFDRNMQIFLIKKLSKEQFINHIEKTGYFKEWLATGNKEMTDFINKNIQVNYLNKDKSKNYEFRKIRDAKIVKKIMESHSEFFENNIEELRAWHENCLSYNENHTKNNRENNLNFYNWAIKIDDAELKTACLKYYRRQFEKTLKYQAFKALPVQEPEVIDHMIDNLAWHNEGAVLAFFKECIHNKDDVFGNHSSGNNRLMLLMKSSPLMVSLMGEPNFILPEEIANKSFIYTYQNTPLISDIKKELRLNSIFVNRTKLNLSHIPDNIPIEYIIGDKKGQQYLLNSLVESQQYSNFIVYFFNMIKKRFDIKKENYDLYSVIQVMRAYHVNQIDSYFNKMEKQEALSLAKHTDCNLFKVIVKKEHYLSKLQQVVLQEELTTNSLKPNVSRI